MAIQVFGAGAVQTAYVSYISLDITSNSVTLDWPTSYVNLPYTDPSTGIHYNVLAASMEVTTGLLNVNTVTLPDSTKSGTGQNFIIKNVGASAFSLKKSEGTTLVLIDTGISYWVQLTDNTTSAGEWSVVQFGAGTSEADANLLAGNGLTAIGTKLDTNIPIIQTNTIPTIDSTYRSNLIIWNGGAATIPLPAISGLITEGWYVSFNNQGSAPIILSPTGGATIDGQTQLIIAAAQSLTVVVNGSNWNTLGFGQNQFAVTSVLNLDVSASVNVILTNSQAANLIQQYSGVLTNNITVFFPTSSDYWFVRNATSGNYTLSVRLDGPLGASIIIPQGTQAMIYSDGTTLRLSPNGISSPFGVSNGVDSLNLSVSGGVGTLLMNANAAINIDTSGNTTLSNPLPIGSGGTGATTQPLAANAIFPTAVTAQSLVYWNGANWAVLLPGDEGSTLRISGGVLTWVP